MTDKEIITNLLREIVRLEAEIKGWEQTTIFLRQQITDLTNKIEQHEIQRQQTAGAK